MEWKDYGNYLISDNGDIYSKKRQAKGKNGSTRTIGGRSIKKTLDKETYHKVDLDGKTTRIHLLVAQLFIPNPNNYKHVIHIDGNKTNNSSLNLKWISKEEYHHSINKPITSIHKYKNTKKTKKITFNQITHLQKTLKINLELFKPLHKVYINITYNNSLPFIIEPYMRATGYYPTCTLPINNTCYYMKIIKRAKNLEKNI